MSKTANQVALEKSPLAHSGSNERTTAIPKPRPGGGPTSRAVASGLLSTAPEFTNLPPENVLENLRTAFRSYAARCGSNPVGTNPEITRALDGENPKQTHFLSEEAGMRINSAGELIDPWSTPYFFHQLSGTEMEIHSAGPDRVMWTGDDLVIK